MPRFWLHNTAVVTAHIGLQRSAPLVVTYKTAIVTARTHKHRHPDVSNWLRFGQQLLSRDESSSNGTDYCSN